MDPLQALGWSPHFESHFQPFREPGVEPARVAREDRGRYLLLTPTGEVTAELAGRLRHETRTRAERPAVGDWVAIRRVEGMSVIVAVLPRTSAFVRKVAGDTTEAQVVAANIDTAFLVSGLDHDFNPRRIERFVTAAWESGAQPVVLLNKADVTTEAEARVAEVEAVAPGVPVLALSALTHDGLAALEPWLRSGRTVALLGSSGVGKSTLANALLGHARQATGDVREDDSRGRHTTTHRELLVLPGGVLLLDTPGLRELQLWADESSLASAFPDVEAIAERCRFRDCRHDSEPGCAVTAAVASGELPEERLESWRKLQRELRWLASRQDARARAEEEAKWKAIHKSMKHHPKAGRWKR